MQRNDANNDMINSSDSINHKQKDKIPKISNKLESEKCISNDVLYHDLMKSKNEPSLSRNRSASAFYYPPEEGAKQYNTYSQSKYSYTQPRDSEKSYDQYYEEYSNERKNIYHYNETSPRQNYKFVEQKGSFDYNNNVIGRRKPKIRVCNNCQTRNTPSWRRSLDGKKLLCNACGLYQKLHGRNRPFAVNSEGKTKAIKVGADRIRCVNCNASESLYWRKTLDGRPLCNSCGLYFKEQMNSYKEMRDPHFYPAKHNNGVGVNREYQMRNDDYHSSRQYESNYNDQYQPEYYEGNRHSRSVVDEKPYYLDDYNKNYTKSKYSEDLFYPLEDVKGMKKPDDNKKFEDKRRENED